MMSLWLTCEATHCKAIGGSFVLILNLSRFLRDKFFFHRFSTMAAKCGLISSQVCSESSNTSPRVLSVSSGVSSILSILLLSTSNSERLSSSAWMLILSVSRSFLTWVVAPRSYSRLCWGSSSSECCRGLCLSSDILPILWVISAKVWAIFCYSGCCMSRWYDLSFILWAWRQTRQVAVCCRHDCEGKVKISKHSTYTNWLQFHYLASSCVTTLSLRWDNKWLNKNLGKIKALLLLINKIKNTDQRDTCALFMWLGYFISFSFIAIHSVWSMPENASSHLHIIQKSRHTRCS